MIEKKHLIIPGILLSIILSIVIFSNVKNTGMTVAANTGCCDIMCEQTSRNDCQGNFFLGKECTKLDQCNFGCCIEKEGYCLANYLKGVCQRKGYEFIATSECTFYPKCLIDNKKDIRGYVGYPNVFGDFVDGIPSADPIANIKGNPITLRFISFDNNTRDLKVKLQSDKFQKIMTLYDDGSHNDGNSDDGIYSAIFQSSTYPEFTGIDRINITAIANGETNNISDYFLLSSNKCVPLIKPWEQNILRRNIIFATNANSSDLGQLQTQAQNIVGNMYQAKNIGPKMYSLNFNTIKERIIETSDITIKNKIKTQCAFYDKSKDFLIFFNQTSESCIRKNNSIYIGSYIVFNRTAIAELNGTEEFLDRFCEVSFTKKRLTDLLMGEISEPIVNMTSPEDKDSFTTSIIDITFNATNEGNASMLYEIFMDLDTPETMLSSGKIYNGVHTKKVSVTDGYHDIWVDVIKDNGLIGYSNKSRILINATSFIINISSLNELVYDSSPEINFTIGYKTNVIVDYDILVNGIIFNSNSTAVDVVNTVKTNLTSGDYVIQISAKVGQSLNTKSLPYLVRIK